MSAQEEIDRLKRLVQENTSVSTSIVTLVQGLAQQVRDNADNPEELKAIANQLDADVRKIADAVATNNGQPSPVGGFEPKPEEPVEDENRGEPVLDENGDPVLDDNGNPTFKARRRRR